MVMKILNGVFNTTLPNLLGSMENAILGRRGFNCSPPRMPSTAIPTKNAYPMVKYNFGLLEVIGLYFKRSVRNKIHKNNTKPNRQMCQ